MVFQALSRAVLTSPSSGIIRTLYCIEPVHKSVRRYDEHRAQRSRRKMVFEELLLSQPHQDIWSLYVKLKLNKKRIPGTYILSSGGVLEELNPTHHDSQNSGTTPYRDMVPSPAFVLSSPFPSKPYELCEDIQDKHSRHRTINYSLFNVDEKAN